MQKLFDEDGNEVEAYSKEDFDKATNDAKTIEEEIKSLNEKLSKVSDKEINFKELRDKKETLEKELEGIKTSMLENQNKIMAEIETIKFQEQIRKVVGDDPQLIDKVKYHYSRLSAPKEGEDKRVEEAILLATGGKSTIDGKIFSSGDGNPPTTTKRTGLSEEQIDLGKKLGLSNKELGIE